MNNKENKTQSTNPFPKMEEEVLNFWEINNIFEKSVENSPAGGALKGNYVFYDGPPFGTGEPHYGHILSSVSKDVMPRYWTMKGFRVERKWGWDCHGLPIENIIEQDLKISGKKEIEKIGIDKFNEACRARVLEYAHVWDKMIKRIGRWVDFKNSYKTMDLTFMESVWWAFKEFYKKGLVYEGRRVLLYCPRCETPISNFEVAMDNSYKDIVETSVYVKFRIKNAEKIEANGNLFILAWTTTPWTLPGNVALAIGEKIDYTIIKYTDQKSDEYFILAKDRLGIIKDKYEIIKELKGKNLVGLEYEPLFDLPAMCASGKKVYYVAPADFVTTEDGTGVVHTAVVYGEDDYNLGLKLDLPVIPALDNQGHFNETVPQFKGVYFKKADKLIIDDLEKRNLLFKKEDITHSYPHCHRCGTQLFYNAIPAWFINIEKLRKRMLELNKKINWYPEHLKFGRFAKGIEQAPDWNISRNRFFATPIPIWKCASCGKIEIIGNIDELKKKSSNNEINDIHSHFIDKLEWPCLCGEKMQRIKEVFDCWFESGSMPFAQMHYPFENEKKFKENFPAQFISEYISQTRAWFYVMHVVSTALFDSQSYENVVTTGVILNEKGDKMSKSKKNFPDPWKVINENGVDALRFYLMSSSVMHAENLFFNERELVDIFRKNIMILWNVYKFYEMYNQSLISNDQLSIKNLNNILDKWIVTRLNQTVDEVTTNMDSYDLPRACWSIADFINDLSTWYLRRSRDRFKSEDENDKKLALQTTQYVLIELSKILAPFMPFLAEQLWQKVTNNNFSDENKSVHLENWPNKLSINNDQLSIINGMQLVRKIVELGLAERDKAGIKVRQVLNQLSIFNLQLSINEYEDLIKDELNIKKIVAKKGKEELKVELDTKITPELKLEGIKRDVVRFINGIRKETGMTIKDRAIIYWESENKLVKEVFKKMGEEIKKDTLSDEIINNLENSENKKEVKIEGESLVLGIKKK